MHDIVTRLLAERMVWVPMPELGDLLPEAAQQFKSCVLGNIPIEDIMTGKYELTGPDDLEAGDPDDGIIAKYPGKNDPSRKRHGVPPDSKVYMQYRLRTRAMLRTANLYQQVFDPFFDLMAKLRSLLDLRIEDMLDQLGRQCQELGRLQHNRERSVIRVMTYLEPRRDDSGLAGKYHTDRNDITLHLYDSVPGLMLKRTASELELVPTRPGFSLAFVSDRLASLTGIPAVLHGARDNGKRQVIVMFVHFHHADGT